MGLLILIKSQHMVSAVHVTVFTMYSPPNHLRSAEIWKALEGLTPRNSSCNACELLLWN